MIPSLRGWSFTLYSNIFRVSQEHSARGWCRGSGRRGFPLPQPIGVPPGISGTEVVWTLRVYKICDFCKINTENAVCHGIAA